MKRMTGFLALLLVLVATAVSAQSLTGTIAGKVVDEQGAVLPGVTVTLTGRQGSVPTVTDERGEFRFVGLNPGLYEVKAELTGFTTRIEAGIDVAIGRTAPVNFTLKVGAMSETVDVVGSAATVDITSTATDNSLSADLLQNMPINLGNFNSATSLLNFTPGVNGGSGFGGDASYGNSLLIDGVDTRDPEGGSAWVFFNYNIVEEVQVGGIGAPAEYGGFSGAVVNTITKSGGNRYSGLFEARHTNDGLAATNVKSDHAAKNPALKGGTVLTKLNDFTVQMGGPLKKDKVFWWFSAQRYAMETDPTGPRTINTEVSPRYNGKLTFQLTPNDTVVASGQWDNYNVTGRSGIAGADFSTDNQTLNQDSPEAVWNLQYRKVFGSSTFLEGKYTGYWGYYYLDPLDTTPARYDADTGGFYAGGAGYIYYADRGRNQANISLSKFADLAGKHTFKFGVEIERSTSKSRFEYMDGVYYVDYSGVPYYAYGYGYLIDGKNQRMSGYAQDSWQAGRLTANLGLRLDRIRGVGRKNGDTIYTPKLALGPRVGAAFDLTGKGTTVLKGFWGRYYEGASINPWQRAMPGFTDFVSYYYDGHGYEEFDRYEYPVYGIDSDINHLGVDEFNVALEHQLRRDMRVSVTYMNRNYINFINSVHPTATWAPTTMSNPLTNGTLGVYRWVNKAASERNVYIKNIDGHQYKDASGNVLGTVDAYRKYNGLMAVLTKSYSNRWQAQLSYVWSKTEGTVNNSGTTSVTGRTYEHPALALVNTKGPMSNDRTHEIKLMGGVQIPKIEVNLSAYYRAISGGTYAYFTRAGGSTLNWTFPPIFSSNRAVFLEPRGSNRLDLMQQIDLRAEKTFNIDVHRFGVFLDVQNLMNTATITGVQSRYPSASIAGNTVLPGAPTSIQGARQVTFGGRWSF